MPQTRKSIDYFLPFSDSFAFPLTCFESGFGGSEAGSSIFGGAGVGVGVDPAVGDEAALFSIESFSGVDPRDTEADLRREL